MIRSYPLLLMMNSEIIHHDHFAPQITSHPCWVSRSGSDAVVFVRDHTVFSVMGVIIMGENYSPAFVGIQLNGRQMHV